MKYSTFICDIDDEDRAAVEGMRRWKGEGGERTKNALNLSTVLWDVILCNS